MAATIAAPRDEVDRLLHEAMEAEAGRMMGLARRMMGNEADAADVLQECWIRAWRNRAAFRADGAPAAWLRAILVRECLRALRWRTVRAWLPFGGEDAEPPAEASDPAGGLELARLRAALAGLAPQQRVIVGLRYEEGWTTPEIAESLGISAETVKTHLQRALGKLRGHLGVTDGP